MTFRQNLFWGGLVVLLFLGALLWAKEQDPFYRKWFTLKTPTHASVKCVAVLPKPMRRYPVIVYAHDAGSDLMKDGVDLRQMAEFGLAVVSLEYNQTNEAAFDTQFGELLHHLSRQRWVNTNAVAWVGSSAGANDMLDFALQHPELQPQLLVQLGSRGIQKDKAREQINKEFSPLHCPVLLVYGEQDEVVPMADVKRLAAALQAEHVPLELKVLPGLPHDLEPERGVVFRAVGEYCLTHLIGKDAWRNYRSLEQWQAKAPPLWLWWLPAALWAGGWWVAFMKSRAKKQSSPLSRVEMALRWVAALLAIGALSLTAIHWVTPLFPVDDTTLNLARRFLVPPKERDDFEYLAAQPIWHGRKLRTLLEHAELANYNRELVNWQVDEKKYRDFVLSPVITGNPDEQLNWRRPLWEEFYPRIRHEDSPEAAARIVARHLRERVTIAAVPDLPHQVPVIWLRQITDKTGFEIIYVAALRSVGVPARLNSQHHAEFWNGNKWQTAPSPAVTSW